MTTIGRAGQRLVHTGCVALLVGACAVGPGGGDSSATPSPSVRDGSPTVDPSPGASVSPLRDQGSTGILTPGTYVLDDFPVDLTFDIPEGDPPGWHVGKSTPDAAVLLWFTPPEISWGVAFWNVDNVYVDPCDAAAGELEPPPGPSVDDLVAALANLPHFQATDPVDVSVGSFDGKQIELTAFDTADACPQAIAWSAGADKTDLSPGDSISAQILDVAGVRIVVTAFHSEQDDAVIEAELQQILDSIRIGPDS